MMSMKRRHNSTNYDSIENLKKDLEDVTVIADGVVGDLTSDVQTVLDDMHAMIGGDQVTIGKVEGSPSLIIRSALQEEHDNNWKHESIEIPDSKLHIVANVHGSHVIY